ncbi:hypothetical protein ACQR2B_17400 [Bradyrhizobium oligotrophicum]|uniref:hypothetical protein n=1 Tax=Bradyrhizobium TaxID=374 RepID=UPI003EB75C0D
MNVSEFQTAPTNKRHPAYAASMLSGTAPEWSTGEVLLSSAYRSLLLGVSESSVDLENIKRAHELMPGAVGGPELWSRLFSSRGGIRSPFRHGQYSPLSSQQLMPLVPSVARIAGVLGKRPRSRWNPSNLLQEIIGSALDRAAGEALIRELGAALAIADDDDVFARFTEASLRSGLQGIQPEPGQDFPYLSLQLGEDDCRAFRAASNNRQLCPSERFCTDLRAVVGLKPSLTRRQWTVLVEAILRLGLGMHALWICKANNIAWELALTAASGMAPPSASEVEAKIWEQQHESSMLLEIGANAEPVIQRHIERYAFARTGLNLLLCRLDDCGASWPAGLRIGFSPSSGQQAPAAIAGFLAHVSANRLAIHAPDAGKWLREEVGKLFDDNEELRALARCKAGYTKNLFEFARHSLGQIQAKDPAERCYDLAYLLAYSGERKPLPVLPGQDMLVMLVHVCCAANPFIPVSLDDFRGHLGQYGLHVPAGELIDGRTGRDLEMLGLVVDSPDAAGGRLLVPPFS